MYTQANRSCNLFSGKLLLILFFPAVLLAFSCSHEPSAERYGFITRLGDDTISVESITRLENTVTIDGIDRFPGVRVRHTVIELAPDGSIRQLVMDIHTPGEPASQRERKVIADVTADSVHISKTDGTGTIHRDFKTGGAIMVAHVPQMYSLYELYFAAALKHAAATKAPPGTPIQMKQFYIDREFDRFPLGDVEVKQLGANKAEINHDWLAGTGEAMMDSNYHMLSYSGARTTYKVDVIRLSAAPDVKSIADRFETLESKTGVVKQLSVRDTVRSQIGNTIFSIDYGRPLMRGRKLLADVLPYDNVWRTGANAATQFITSAPIKLDGKPVPAGKYTLWTIPHTNGVDLIVNTESGQWGTEYDDSRDLWKASMIAGSSAVPVEEFTISILANDSQHGTLVMEWGTFRWTVPIELQ